MIRINSIDHDSRNTPPVVITFHSEPIRDRTNLLKFYLFICFIYLFIYLFILVSLVM